MDSYLSFDAFVEAVNNTVLRKVAADGSIMLDGRVYVGDALLPYAGQHIRAFIDLEGASAVCLTLFDKKFICNAQNPELWAAMMADD